MAPPDSKLEFDLLFWFLNWHKDVDADRFQGLNRKELEESDARIASAELSFYRTTKLLRITQGEFRHRYILHGSAGRVVSLNGTAPVIHETNKIPDELILTDDTADDYLRFFCSAVHGEDGPFLVLDDHIYSQVAMNESEERIRDELRKAAHLGIQRETNSEFRAEFAKLSNPCPDSGITRRKAAIIYSAALFYAWFAIDNTKQNPGMVHMLDDEPILDGLELKLPKSSGGSFLTPPEPAPRSVHYSDRELSRAEREELDLFFEKLGNRVARFDKTGTGATGMIDTEVIIRDRSEVTERQ